MKPPSARVRRTRSVLVEPRAPYRVKAGDILEERCSSSDAILGLFATSFSMRLQDYSVKNIGRGIERDWAGHFIHKSKGLTSDRVSGQSRSLVTYSYHSSRYNRTNTGKIKPGLYVWLAGSLPKPNQASADACSSHRGKPPSHVRQGSPTRLQAKAPGSSHDWWIRPVVVRPTTPAA